MTTTSAVRKRISRTTEQIDQANDQAESLADQIRELNSTMSSKLSAAKLDADAIQSLEDERDGLERQRARLLQRVTALEGTVPDLQLELVKAQLEEARQEHKDAVEAANIATENYSQHVPELAAELEDISATLRTRHQTVNELASKIRYLNSVLNGDGERLKLEFPKVPDNLTIDRVARSLNKVTRVSGQAVARGGEEWASRLQKLSTKRRNEAKTKKREEKEKENALAGW